MRRVISQDPRPAALAAVDAPIVNVATDVRIEYRLGDCHAEQIVLWRLEVTEPLSKDAESPINRRLDDDLTTDCRFVCLGHDAPSVGCSTTSL